jgi:hypothetical protein
VVLAALGAYMACALAGALLGAAIGGVGRWMGWARPALHVATPPRRCWRFFVRLCFCLLGVLAALWVWAGFHTGGWLGRVVDRHLTDMIDDADRDDPNWRLGDLMAHREPVPNAENSAPIVARAAALLPLN